MTFDSPSLLITDDDRDFRETLAEVFASRGYQPILAGDGGEALEIVRQRPIHLLLLDMHMPRVSGLETMRTLRREHLAIPCILLSAALDEEIIAQAHAADAFSVLPKPIRLAEITRLVAQAFKQVYGWPT